MAQQMYRADGDKTVRGVSGVEIGNFEHGMPANAEELGWVMDVNDLAPDGSTLVEGAVVTIPRTLYAGTVEPEADAPIDENVEDQPSIDTESDYFDENVHTLGRKLILAELDGLDDDTIRARGKKAGIKSSHNMGIEKLKGKLTEL